ncbi:MAG: acyltransferase [Pelolinea sp.]|nr:acyltransferase [Pelolinea sp.]
MTILRTNFPPLQPFYLKLITAIKVLWWKLFYNITIGRGTIIRELRYISTDSGPIKIGHHCVINALALAGPIEIGNNTLVNLHSDISGRKYKVIIGDNVLIAPHVAIMATIHNYKNRYELIKNQGTDGGDVVIEDDVWIGTNVVILPGTHIEKGAVIGANAVVTNDIPPYAIAVGIPAKVSGYRE